MVDGEMTSGTSSEAYCWATAPKWHLATLSSAALGYLLLVVELEASLYHKVLP